MKRFTLLFLVLYFTVLFSQDKQKETPFDAEIQQREQQLTQLLQNIDASKKQIEQTEKQAIYMQGALDLLRTQRTKFLSDTLTAQKGKKK